MPKHDLKIWPAHFFDIRTGRKTFEVRKADRDFQPGDTLLLREWDPESETYTGSELVAAMPYVAWNAPGVQRDYVVLSVVPAPARDTMAIAWREAVLSAGRSNVLVATLSDALEAVRRDVFAHMNGELLDKTQAVREQVVAALRAAGRLS